MDDLVAGDRSAARSPARLVLGTAQWGMSYGVANRTGPPEVGEVARLLATASAAGVRTIDTAHAYGPSEALIGELARGKDTWRVVTKVTPDAWQEGIGRATALERLDSSLRDSRAALGLDRLDTVLLHRGSHRTALGGALWAELRRRRDAGEVRRVGVSAVNPDEAFEALADADVGTIQVAASLLDRRLERAGFFRDAASAGREVFVRSVFLQGAAFLDGPALPLHLRPLVEPLEAIRAWAHGHGCGMVEAFLWAVRRLPVAGVLIGCETVAQLQQDLDAWTAQGPTGADLEGVAALVDPLPDEVLDPSRWPHA
ncbi:MAG: aldo/keto reductase [Chloroflexi bacterium]|nr:aldo/keto reductase [Chloroflexota bacterium]